MGAPLGFTCSWKLLLSLRSDLTDTPDEHQAKSIHTPNNKQAPQNSRCSSSSWAVLWSAAVPSAACLLSDNTHTHTHTHTRSHLSPTRPLSGLSLSDARRSIKTSPVNTPSWLRFSFYHLLHCYEEEGRRRRRRAHAADVCVSPYPPGFNRGQPAWYADKNDDITFVIIHL